MSWCCRREAVTDRDVSRESPAAPPEARRVFADDRLELAERYAASLATDGLERGLIGPREVPRLWDRHLLNCAALAGLIPEAATVADVGSGAGLPGLVLALARPDLRITLIEPLLRRTTYLSEVIDTLHLDHVEVVRGRADALHGRRVFDVVTSRAVAPLERLLPWSMPLVAQDGELVAMKGSSVVEEVDAVGDRWSQWRLEPARIETIGSDLPGGGTSVVRVAWAGHRLVSLPLGSERGSRASSARPGARGKRSRP